MNTEKKLISVMVPVYNVAPYITNCLESLIHQTYTNLEIILVDDGSTDNSLEICQEYASLNRIMIADTILKEYSGFSMAIYFTQYGFETIHNYISFEDNIVRKGAISAKKGEKVLIPINMRDGSIIAVGKGNKDWNNSAPHGAGRLMSRRKAKETFNLEEFKKSMEDIYSTSVLEETIDEAPFVYKPMQEIIDNIQDTVEIEKIIEPIYNFKAKN